MTPSRDAQPLKIDCEDFHDVIVIGAGLSGLTTAPRLAKARLKTLLVEQEQHVGGSISFSEWEKNKRNRRLGRRLWHIFSIVPEKRLD